jgi:hypothetical protein
VFRNYWWGAGDLDRPGADPLPGATRRFAASALVPACLDAAHRRDPAAHFREVLARCLAERAGDPVWARMDHAYLFLRMQCWQGSIAGATNQLWPNLSPLLWRGPLEVLFALDPRTRLRGRLFFDLFARFPSAFSRTPLATGFPPLLPSFGNAWRFVPGLLAQPPALAARARRRFFPRPDPAAAGIARRLAEGGAADLLAFGSLELAPLLDRAATASFLEGLAAGSGSLALLGRLLAAESAFRAARGQRAPSPRS